jgi:thiol-disulfide isomerase/thioredoxin
MYQRTMKIKILISIIAACFLFGIAVYSQSYVDPWLTKFFAGRPSDRLWSEKQFVENNSEKNLPEFRLSDINGDPVISSSFTGNIVFLNFWTTWCPSCVMEMPAMERLHQKLISKDFVMVAINIKEPASQVERFVHDHKFTFKTLLDTDGNVASMFGVHAIPTTFIYDKLGNLIGTAIGQREWDSRTYMAMFEDLANDDTLR